MSFYSKLMHFRVFYQSENGTPLAKRKYNKIDERSVSIRLRDVMCQRTNVYLQYFQLQVVALYLKNYKSV